MRQRQIKKVLNGGVLEHDISHSNKRSDGEKKRLISRITKIVIGRLSFDYDNIISVRLFDGYEQGRSIRLAFQILNGRLYFIDDLNSTVFFESVKYFDSIELKVDENI